MHNAAINKEPLQGTSPFQERDALRNEVLVKVFPKLCWLVKEEVANKKATPLT